MPNMKTVVAVAVVVCGGLTQASAWAQTGRELSPSDVAKIKELSQVHARTALAKDWAGYVSTFLDDGVMYPPNEVALKGRAAIRAWVERFPAITQFTASTNEVHGRDDLAFALGTYKVTIAPAGGAPVRDTGKFVEIVRRQPNGQWLVSVDMFSSDLPPATAAK